mmetsp:Transcript_19936/g.35057  ORF Transcript_19936/g.35057 Transcript_19936/m.35057 type:complete len:416 (+) Transcript_19936:181-1428(+)
MPPRKKKEHFDGRRGPIGALGRWISLKEATELAGGDEWWKQVDCEGRTVFPHQYDPSGPKNKPVWLFDHGDMYLGEWKVNKRSNNKSLFHGFGIIYNKVPKNIEGLVYIGGFKDGLCHGKGKGCWSETCEVWRSNVLKYSVINQKINKNGKAMKAGVPFIYIGRYEKDVKSDPKATVILKDGTKRVGPWENGVPIGDWWVFHIEPEDSIASHSELSAPPSSARRSTRPLTDPLVPERGRKLQKTARWSIFSTNCNRQRTRENQEEGKEEEKEGEEDHTEEGVNMNSDAVNGHSIEGATAPQPSQAHVKQEQLQAQVKQEQNPEAASRETDQAVAEENLRVWLRDVIEIPIANDIKNYAAKLIELGLDTPKTIQKYCTKKDVIDFSWMKKFHKPLFIDNARLEKKGSGVKNAIDLT